MKNKSFYKYVLVDFDGTLIDSIGSLYTAYRQLLSLYNLKGNKCEFNDLNGPSTFEIVEILKSKHNISATTEEIYQRYIDLIDKNYHNSEPFKDSELFLSKLYNQNIKIILVTSGRSETCTPIIKKLGWQSYFDSFMWGEDVKQSKPSPDIYLKVLKQANVDKNQLIVIEDSINGVKSASNAGLTVFGLTIDFEEDDLRNAGAKKVFKNLSSILDHMLK